ncbi:MAG: hypothetical protein Q9208_002725 [Pyrenodesmia sp. 3 TL-2023]
MNRSHFQETLISTNELLEVIGPVEARLRGINSYGLQEVIDYSGWLEERLRHYAPPLQSSMERNLKAYDSLNNVNRVLDSIGLSHCRQDLEEALSHRDKLSGLEVDHEERKSWRSPPWTAYSKGFRAGAATTTAMARAPQIITMESAISATVYHTWAIYTLIHSLRCSNMRLHRDTLSRMPPREFHQFHKRPAPLQLSAQENETVSSLAWQISKRAILPFPIGSWNWTNPATDNISLSAFPARLPCPRTLGSLHEPPWSYVCDPTLPRPLPQPNTTTHNRLLGLHYVRDTFVLVRDMAMIWEQAVEQLRDLIHIAYGLG